jgi:hypothetical protein
MKTRGREGSESSKLGGRQIGSECKVGLEPTGEHEGGDTHRAEAKTHEDLRGADLKRGRVHAVNPIVNVLQEDSIR